MNIAIIGGGYAGMAAAVELSDRGIPVSVFESARQLGGRARGVVHQDTQLDNGQHLLLGCYYQTLRMIDKVGGNPESDFLRLPLQLDLHGEFFLKAPRLPAPLHLLVALLGATGLSLAARMNAARFMLALRHMNFRLTSDMTVTELLAQYGQDKDLANKLWEPLCIAALNTPIHKASSQVLLNVLRDALNRSRADSDMLLPRIDFTALFPQRAAKHVEQHGGKLNIACGVEALRPSVTSYVPYLLLLPPNCCAQSLPLHKLSPRSTVWSISRSTPCICNILTISICRNRCLACTNATANGCLTGGASPASTACSPQ
jgi:predicted NAD/FAD-binding protein